MSTAAQYGSTPGVVVYSSGGGINQIEVGREQKLVVFGRGDPSAGSASINDPTKINTRVDPSTQFGAGTELADGLSLAYANGANLDYLYGVMPEEISVSSQPIAGGSGGLNSYPIIEDKPLITVENTTGGTTLEDSDVHLVYDTTVATPASGVNLNPLTGVLEAADSDDYAVSYSHLDWQSALDSADNVLLYGETGIYSTLSDANAVNELLEDKVGKEEEDGTRYGLRPDYKLVKGVGAAMPNATGTDGSAQFDWAAYTDSIDNDAMFLAGPMRRDDGSGFTAVGAAAGVFAGHALTNPVYGDGLAQIGKLNQTLTTQDETDARAAQVIPVQDNAGDTDAGVALEDNLSTSTKTDWQRDFHRVRIHDQIVLLGREVGQTARKQRITDQVLNEVENAFTDELQNFVEDGLLEANPETGDGQQGGTQEEQKYFVDASKTGNDTIGIAAGFTPVDIAKTVRVDLTVGPGPSDVPQETA